MVVRPGRAGEASPFVKYPLLARGVPFTGVGPLPLVREVLLRTLDRSVSLLKLGVAAMPGAGVAGTLSKVYLSLGTSDGGFESGAPDLL